MRKGDETRLKIVDLALHLFHKQGFHQVTLPKLSKELGISHAAIYTYFDDRMALLGACALQSMEEIRKYVDQQARPADPASVRLRAYLRANLEWVAKHPEFAGALLSLYYYGTSDKSLRDLHAQLDADSIARLSALLYQGNHEKAWALKAPDQTAGLVHSLIVGELIKAFHWPRATSRTQRTELLWEAVQKLVGIG